ncbi:MAG: hypothetical protein JNJ61_05160 [Anaerolineae bacterium]|nr:hypothetical protein [Anaerolineae bacterium]
MGNASAVNTSPSRGCGMPCQVVLLTLTIGAALAVSTLVAQGYIALVQRPACYAYAARSHSDVDNLEFEGVTIATNQFRGHVCNFRARDTGFPVAVAYDEADVPYLADTMQVLSMVCGLLCSGLALTGLLSAALLRLGIQPYWIRPRKQTHSDELS